MLELREGDHMVMDLNNTIKTFECCTQKPPDCANCPEEGPGFGFACKQDVIKNVLYWLKTQVPAVPGIVDDVVVRIATKTER